MEAKEKEQVEVEDETIPHIQDPVDEAAEAKHVIRPKMEEVGTSIVRTPEDMK